MADALLLSRDLLVELHHLLRDFDFPRWRADAADAFLDRATALRQRLESTQRELAEAWDAGADEASQRAREAWDRLTELLDGLPDPGTPAREVRRHWRRLRRQLLPVYAAAAEALGRQGLRVPDLRLSNLPRTAFHVASASAAILVVELFLGPRGMFLVALGLALLAWTLQLTRRYSRLSDRLSWALLGRTAHPHERYRVNSATWYATALLGLSLTGSPLLAVLALAVLGYGDPAAGTVGRRWGRTRLLHGRTLEGSLAFVAAGTLAALAVLRLGHPGLGWGLSLALAGAAALAGAVAELFSRSLDDNLSIPLAAASGAGLLALLLGLPLQG